MKVCRVCGKPVGENARFCTHCGSRQEILDGQAGGDIREAGGPSATEGQAEAEISMSAEGPAAENLSAENPAVPEDRGALESPAAARPDCAESSSSADGPKEEQNCTDGQEAGSGAPAPSTGETVQAGIGPGKGPIPGQRSFQGQEGSYRQPYGQQGYPAQPQPAPARKSGLIWVGIGAAVLCFLLILLGGILFVRSRPVTVDISKYAEIETSGFDGYGRSEVSFDEIGFGRDVLVALAKKGEITSRVGRDVRGMEEDDLEDYLERELALRDPKASGKLYKIRQSFYYMLNKEEALKNGDRITLTFDYSNDYLKKYHIRFTDSELVEEVSDLKEVRTFDAFKDLKVSFSGNDGSGWIEIDQSADSLKDLYFEADKSSGLSLGDRVTVQIHDMGDNFEYYAESTGQVPEETSRTYTVEGLIRNVTKIDQIPEEILEAMKTQAMDVLKELYADSPAEKDGFSSADYLGGILLTPKDSDWYSNEFYLVYKVHDSSELPDYDDNVVHHDQDYYWCIGFSDLTLDGEGKCEVDLTYHIPVFHSFSFEINDRSYYMDGYLTMQELTSDLVDSNASDYSSESTVRE